MLDFVPVVVAAGGTVGEAVDHILATKLLRKVRDRHDTRPEDLDALAGSDRGGVASAGRECCRTGVQRQSFATSFAGWVLTKRYEHLASSIVWGEPSARRAAAL